jgi:methylornithine synthase
MDRDAMSPFERVRKAIKRARVSGVIDPEDLAFILSITPKDAELAKVVFTAARDVRYSLFLDKIALYGFVYLSTYCHNNCAFCNYRTSNASMPRYRKEPAEIIEIGLELFESGVNLVDLTLGEDDAYLTGRGFDNLLKIIERLSSHQRFPIMISPGVLDFDRLKEAKAAGATWYALYQETYNRTLFRKLRPGQDFNRRAQAKELAREAGYFIEDGVLIGVGASTLDLVYSILSMAQNENHQMRAMAYVPVPGGILPDPSVVPSWQELLVIACLRLLAPYAYIPASLDVNGLAGLELRLMAGANAVTSIVPPDKGLRGVASMDLDIDNHNRSAEKVRETLKDLNYTPFTTDAYRNSFYVNYEGEKMELSKFFSKDLPQDEAIKRRHYISIKVGFPPMN